MFVQALAGRWASDEPGEERVDDIEDLLVSGRRYVASLRFADALGSSAFSVPSPRCRRSSVGSAHLERPTSSLMVGWWRPRAVGLYTDHGCHRETLSLEQMRGDGAAGSISASRRFLPGRC